MATASYGAATVVKREHVEHVVPATSKRCQSEKLQRQSNLRRKLPTNRKVGDEEPLIAKRKGTCRRGESNRVSVLRAMARRNRDTSASVRRKLVRSHSNDMHPHVSCHGNKLTQLLSLGCDLDSAHQQVTVNLKRSATRTTGQHNSQSNTR
jgi:hypothetical protein